MVYFVIVVYFVVVVYFVHLHLKLELVKKDFRHHFVDIDFFAYLNYVEQKMEMDLVEEVIHLHLNRNQNVMKQLVFYLFSTALPA